MTSSMKTEAKPIGLLILACCASQFVHTVYGSAVNIALPQISAALKADTSDLQWVVSAYVLALASLLIFGGTLADRFGRKKILIIGNCIMVAGAVVCALSPSVAVLSIGRTVQGIGSAMMAPAGLSLLSVAAPTLSKRALAIVWWTAVGTATLAAGPILGGFIVRGLGWRWVFWVGIILGVVAILLALWILEESKSSAPDPFDVPGLLLMTLFLASLAYCMFEGSTLGWLNWSVLLAAGLALVSLIFLIPLESHHPHPVLPIRLFKNTSFTIAICTAIFGYLALAALLFSNTFYLQGQRHLDPMSAGMLTIPLAAGATITALISGKLVVKGDSKLILRVSGVLMLLGALGLWVTSSANLWWTLIPYTIFGAGFGFIADPISVIALSSLPNTEASLASSFISTSKQMGQMVGIGGSGIILGAGATQAQLFEKHGWGIWLFIAGFAVLVLLLNIGKPVHRNNS